MKSPTEPKVDNRQARSEATQQALMRAAEKLIAQRGIENVTTRDILTEAGQRNTSALQYHFKSFPGLVKALRKTRNAQIKGRRAALVQEALARRAEPPLREVCKLMVAPAFQLARADAGFRRYIKAFGHEITLAEESALAVAAGQGDADTRQIGTLLRKALPHLSSEAFARRLDGALRLISASMVHQAHQKQAFAGAEADLFFSSLIDAVVGLLSANESEQTRSLRESVSTRKHA